MCRQVDYRIECAKDILNAIDSCRERMAIAQTGADMQEQYQVFGDLLALYTSLPGDIKRLISVLEEEAKNG